MSNPGALTETIASTATIKLAQLPESTLFCTPIEERFERITRIARRALGVPVAAITFLNEEKQWFKSVAGWQVSELPNSQSFCPITLAAAQMTIFEDTTQDSALRHHPLVTSGPQFRFYAAVPISDDGEQLCGTFCVFDQRPRQLSLADRATLRDLAALTQQEIMNERMRSVHSSLTAKLGIARRESMMDPLTRLWNRRGADVMLKSAAGPGREQGGSVAIAVVDLDNFKQINDTYGHQAGDEVLRKTALKLIQNVRADDSVCRVGGDEFLLILKNYDAATVRNTTERIREQVSSAPISTRHGNIPLRISVGYTLRPANDETPVEDLIAEADRALMQSKTGGRNRVSALF